jgi:hypothetical protein
MDTVRFGWLDEIDTVERGEYLDLPQFELFDIEHIDCSKNYSTGKFK